MNCERGVSPDNIHPGGEEVFQRRGEVPAVKNTRNPNSVGCLELESGRTDGSVKANMANEISCRAFIISLITLSFAFLTGRDRIPCSRSA